MKLKIRYSSSTMQQFGVKEREEYVTLPENATYEDLLEILKEKYRQAVQDPKIKYKTDKELKEFLLDYFFIIAGGVPIKRKMRELVRDEEVVIASLSQGG